MSHPALRPPAHRLVAAIAATTYSALRAKTVLAGCRRWTMEKSCALALISFWWMPTIKPIITCAQSFSAHGPHCKVTCERFRACQPIDAPLTTGRLLGATGAVPASTLVGAQRIRWVVQIFVQHVGDHRRVFDGHAGTLCKKGQHRVGCVSDERHGEFRAAEGVLAVIERPFQPAVRN